MDRDDDGETSYKYNTFVDDVAIEPTYLQALPTAAGRNVATGEIEAVRPRATCMYLISDIVNCERRKRPEEAG